MVLNNLHVRAYLRSGVVSDGYMPLDGILLYQAHRDQLGVQVVTPPEYDGSADITLPLAVANEGTPDWYYKCSWAIWPKHTVHAKEYWNKRFDTPLEYLVDFQGRRGKIETGKGRYKSYHTLIYYRAALWLDWYCVGDFDAIAYLLSTVTHIGKKATQGWGRVIRWEITPIEEDASVWLGGRLVRGVPVPEAPSAPTGMYGIRPPYWGRANLRTLALPER
jgi:CRISPR type IV-associated protein Csf3